MSILDYLETFKQSYGPEWGSGGVFGLKYHRGVFYFTLAMEARAYFIDGRGIRRIYEFDKVGPKPISGGDTYNAVEAVDDKIFFGGWVHAPVVYRGRLAGLSTIDFRNKYSHVHYYDISNDKIELLWKDSMHDSEKWVGEVSEIIYNPYRDELLIARADGHENLGVFSIDPKSGKADRIVSELALKGTHHLDYACFVINQHPYDMEGVVCVDLVEKDHIVNKKRPISIDGEPATKLWAGPVASAYGWLFVFSRGGFVLGDVFSEEYYFVRLFDIPGSQLSPTRTKSVYLGGGILIPYNAYTYGVIRTYTKYEKTWKEYLGATVSPTLLLYLAPPTIKPVAAMGARITSAEVVGDKIVLGTNTMSNTQRYDASPFDQGVRGFTIFSQDIVTAPPVSVEMTIPGWMIRGNAFGGIPLAGYTEPKIIIYSKKQQNKLIIREYYLTLPPTVGNFDAVDVKFGKNIIDLSSYNGIVSFKAEKPLGDDEIVVIKLQ